MRAGGWKPFWTALWITLLVLLPLAGGTVLLTRNRLRQNRVQASESQSGIAIKLPRQDDQLTLLLCTAEERPGFVLLYLNASQNCINLLAVPAELEVSFGTGEATLAECYAAAGPARSREALGAAFALPEDTHYLAMSSGLQRELAAPYGALRVSLLSALSSGELAQAGLPGAAQELTAGDAQTLLYELDIADNLQSEKRAAVRAAVWDAFFRQKLELLPASLPDALRANSEALLTDLAAQDYYLLEETLEFLANNAAPVQSAALPGVWDAATHRYTVNDASLAAVQALFNVSPTDIQAESGSAP